MNALVYPQICENEYISIIISIIDMTRSKLGGV